MPATALSKEKEESSWKLPPRDRRPWHRPGFAGGPERAVWHHDVPLGRPVEPEVKTT